MSKKISVEFLTKQISAQRLPFGCRLYEFIDATTSVKYLYCERGGSGGTTMTPRLNVDGSVMLATSEEIEELMRS